MRFRKRRNFEMSKLNQHLTIVSTIKITLLGCALLVFSASTFSQDSSAIINFKHRLLRTAKQNNDDIASTDSFRILHLMIAGNIYQTEKHISYCFIEGAGKYNFKDEFKYVQPLLGIGDISIANLRTSFSGDNKNMFSAPDEFALQLKYSGVNTLMHANLHTANVSKTTLKRTRQVLNTYDMFHTGAFTDNNQRNGNYPLIISKKGFRLAILNYTSLLTRPSISRDFIINEFDKTLIERDLRMARANQPDFIIVYFDWGAKEQSIPNQQQMDLAQFVFQRGANIVVGTNPNAPMRIDLINYMDNGQLREGIAAYSLGNLIASNDEVNNRNGFLLDIELKKNNYTHTTGINDWGVIPVYTHYDTTTVKGQMKVFSVPCWAVENGEILKNIPYIEKRRSANSAYEIRKLVGAVADEIQYNLNELIVNNVQETIDITNAPLNNKFSIAREEDVEPTEPPVLPVATIGSNNPPSLASIYEPVHAGSKPGIKPLIIENNISADQVAVQNEAQRTNNVSTILAAATSAATVASLVGVKKATAITSEEINSASSTPKISNAQNNIGISAVSTENTLTAQNSAITKNADKKTTTTISKTQEPNLATVSTSEKSIAPKADSSSSSDNAKVQTETVSIDEEERKRQAANYDYANNVTKNKPANTNYRSTGKDYDVAIPTYTDRTKPKSTVTTENREKVNDIEISSKNTKEIGTGISGAIQPNLASLKEVNMKMVVDTFYRIQFYALKKFIPLDTNYYTHLKGYEVREEDGLFKYLLGKYKTLAECEKLWKSQIQPRYKQSFIIKYVDGKRILE